MAARLSDIRVDSTLALANQVCSRPMVTSGSIQRLLGIMASAHAVVPLGLLHVRPIRRWYALLHLDPVKDLGRVLRFPPCLLPVLRHWARRSYLEDGVPMGAPVGHLAVFTDTSVRG